MVCKKASSLKSSWVEIITIGNKLRTSYNTAMLSLLAEALFLVFADGRKETSAMDRNWLWFNRRPRSWTAVLQRMLLAVLADRNLSPLRLAHFFTLILLSFIEPTLLDITRSFYSGNFDRKKLQSLFFFCFGLPRRWKDKKKLSEEQFKALFHFLNRRDTFVCLATGDEKTLIYHTAVLVARKVKPWKTSDPRSSF